MTTTQNEVDELLTRQNGLHGIQHQFMGGKNLAFEYCNHCKEAKTAITKLILKKQLKELHWVQSNGDIYHAVTRVQDRIAELKAELDGLEKV